jgi:hypothetical protein
MTEYKRAHAYSPVELSPEVRAYARERYPVQVLTALVAMRFASECHAINAGRGAVPMQLTDLNRIPKDELLELGRAAMVYLEGKALGSMFYDNHIFIHGPWPGTGKTQVAAQLINEFRDGPVKHTANFEFVDKTHTELLTPTKRIDVPKTPDDIDHFVLQKLAETLGLLFRLRKDRDSEHIVIGGITQRLGALAAYLHLFQRSETGELIVPEHWEKLQLLSAIAPYALVFVDAPLQLCIERARNQAIKLIIERTPGRQIPVLESELLHEHAYAKRQAAFHYALTIREFAFAVMSKMRNYSANVLQTPLPLYYLPNYRVGDEFGGPIGQAAPDVPAEFIECAHVPHLAEKLREGYNPTKLNLWLDNQERMMGGPPLMPRFVNRRQLQQK